MILILEVKRSNYSNYLNQIQIQIIQSIPLCLGPIKLQNILYSVINKFSFLFFQKINKKNIFYFRSNFTFLRIFLIHSLVQWIQTLNYNIIDMTISNFIEFIDNIARNHAK